MTEKLKSADDLIVRDEAAKLGKPLAEAKVPQKELPLQEDIVVSSEHESKELAGEEQEEQTEESKEKSPVEVEAESSVPQQESDGEDEYGSKIETKKKLYTQEEVERMMRDRLKRGNHPEQIKEAVKDFTPNPESEENWEVQLEGFVAKTIQKISQKQADEQWHKQQAQSQAEFEVKFSQGMEKYKDFESIVAGKPITGSMMLATKSMNDPAAFLYAACKQHPKELARIAEMGDPVSQATEIGRLEERMKRTKSVPVSPKPASRISGDTTDDMPQLSIDQRISAHAKSKILDRR